MKQIPENDPAGKIADPMKRLLWRLDHAPADLSQLESSASRGTTAQQTGRRYADAIAPILPVLQTMSQSKALETASHIPFIGAFAQSVQNALSLASLLGSGFQSLTRLDGQYVQPLRDAIVAGSHLKRSRNRRDVPDVIKRMDAAARTLNEYEKAALVQQTRLDALGFFLARFDTGGKGVVPSAAPPSDAPPPSSTPPPPAAESDGPQKSREAAAATAKEASLTALRNAAHQLLVVRQSLTTRLQSVRTARIYAEACADDGRTVMASPP